MSETLDLSCALIERPSVTPDDAGCQRLLAERLLPLGFEARWFHCGDVSNVLFTHGRAGPATWLLGHTDVVPPGPLEDWTSPPFQPEVRDGLLFGRGACDMKGAVAAMVVALERLVEQHPDHAGQVGLLLTSDEEGDAIDGIRRVADALPAQGLVPDHCLVGEPSSQDRLGDTVRIGRRGSHAVTLTVPGKQGHTAFPETIDNPVHRLAPFLAELTSRAWDDGIDDERGRFPPTHCQVSNVRAGVGAMNVTPASIEITVSLRNNPHWTGDSLKAEFESLLAAHGITEYTLDWWVSGEPFLSHPGPLRDAVVKGVQAVLGISPQLNTGGGTSDGRFIAPLGTEVVELGLVNATIHQVNECVRTKDLDDLADTYTAILRRLHP